MGHVSDPYNEDDAEGELAITGLPDDLEAPPADVVVPSDTDEPADVTDDDEVDDDEVDDDEVDDDEVDDDDEDLDDVDVGLDDEPDEEVAYTLDDFDDEQLDTLFDALDEAVIPYLWDGDELFVQEVDEQAVDELLERVANPHEIASEDGDGDGGGWLLGELFVTADRLQRDPEEHETVASLLQLANASDEATVPYGLADTVWEQLRDRVSRLATILEQDQPDPDEAIEAARELRSAVRPYV